MKPSNKTSSRIKLCCALIGMVAASGACGVAGGASSAPPGETAPVAAASSSHAGHGATGAAVEMRLIQFRPARIEVAAGGKVAWSQSDAGFHTVTSGTVTQEGGGVSVQPDGKFGSQRLATGQTFEFTFTEPGTYSYFCEIHPATMTGEVRVGK